MITAARKTWLRTLGIGSKVEVWDTYSNNDDEDILIGTTKVIGCSRMNNQLRTKRFEVESIESASTDSDVENRHANFFYTSNGSNARRKLLPVRIHNE